MVAASRKKTASATRLEAARPIKLPKTLAACADRLYQIREEKGRIKAELEKVEREEGVLREHIIEQLPKSDATGIAGKIARAKIESKSIPTARDWDKIHAYIKKTGNFDIVQRRLSVGAVNELLDAKKKVPGVEMFQSKTVSVTKL